MGREMAKLPLEPRLARFLLGWPTAEGRKASAWLARGGDGARPELEGFLHSGGSFPEERTLRPSQAFAGNGLTEALLAAFPDRVACLRRGQDLVLCDGSGYQIRPLEKAPTWLLALDLELGQERQAQLLA